MRLWHILAVSVLSGCAAVPAARWIAAEDSDGIVRRVLHLDGVPCPTAISAAPDTAGCHYSGPIVFTGGAGESVEDAAQTLEHELDHHRGLRHGPWNPVGSDKCALILASGRTTWREGWLICRGRHYYTINPALAGKGE